MPFSTAPPAPLPSSHSNLSKPDAAHLARMNSSIDRMRDFTPQDPYILTIPQWVEPRYHHSFRYQACQWLDNAPFQRDEDANVQYQTYHYYEPGTQIYVQTNSQLENGPKQRRNGEISRDKSVTPAVHDGPKKKISLAAYKSKQAGGSSVAKQAEEKAKLPAAAGKAPIKGPIERVKQDTIDLPEIPAIEDFHEERPSKRKHERVDSLAKSDDMAHVASQEAGAVSLSQPSKKPRLEEPAKSTLDPPAAAKVSPARPPSPPLEMPPRLSPPPLLAPQRQMPVPSPISPAEDAPMPDRLSPTLPANIAASLAARAHAEQSSNASPVSKKDSLRDSTASKSSADDKPSPGDGPQATKKLTPAKSVAASLVGLAKKSPTPRNGFRANSGSPAVRSVEDAPRYVPAPDLSQYDEAVITKALIEHRQLIVKLKVKKHQRDRLKQILKMRPTPKATKDSPPQSSAVSSEDTPVEAKNMERRPSDRRERDATAKGVAQKVGPSTSGASAKGTTAEKRVREVEKSAAGPPTKRIKHDPEEQKEDPAARRKNNRPEQAPYQPPAKRKQAPDALIRDKEPSTPIHPDLKSPSILSSAQKSQQVTPTNTRKDLLSVAMNRDRSTDSNANTPGAQNRTPAGVTSGSSRQPNGISKSSGLASNKAPMQVAWEAEQKRLDALGRELKHAAQKHISALKDASSDATSSREAKLAAVKSLESLLAYILCFSCSDEACAAADPKKAPAVAPWRTLTGFFSFVKRNCDAFPDLAGLACMLGIVFNGRILAITAAHPTEGPSRDSLIEVNAASMRAEAEGKDKLPLRRIQRDFTKTWEAGLAESAGSESLKPGEYAGGFELPIGQATASIQGVRAGMSLLGEWCEEEGLEYRMKLTL